MKNQRGITLIALVVTIVVLLILAGITMTFVLADGGIFGTAKDARVESEAGVIRDYVGQMQATYMTKYWTTVTANADGVPTDLDETEIKAMIEATLPAIYSITNYVDIEGSSGLLNGSFDVTSSKITTHYFAVVFSDGVGTVTVTKGAPTP